MFFARKLEGIVALAILSLLVTNAAYSQSSSKSDDPIQFELAGMGKRGGVIARAREQVLVVLQTENACTAWFREADPDPAGVFRSLHYEIERDKPSYIFRMLGGQLLKHPWAARTTQNRGRNAIVELNAIGLFFNSRLPVLEVDSRGAPIRLEGFQALTIASFRGETNEAQITTLLHELGHIVGRIPADDDSWDRRSSRNTAEVLRYCKDEIRVAAQRRQRSAN